MARYSKSYSNYVLKRRHQTLEDGSTIFERDWGTLGERNVIESGKKKVYADANFLFTDNTRFGSKYRNNTGEWSDPYSMETLGDNIDKTVNDTSIINESNDIRDYAYYGSAAELVRASIENIVKWFPGRFWSTDSFISRLNNEGDGWVYLKNVITDGHHNYAVEYTDDESSCNIYVVENPFTIDFYNTNIALGKYDNILRNMPLSYKSYELNGGIIRTWNVWIKPYSDCDENYTIKYDVTFTYENGNSIDSGHLYGVVIDKTVVWCTTVRDMNVQPLQEIIDEYFKNLVGFEAKLLNRKNHPLYTTKFITPVPYGNNNPSYLYIERSYSWPHDGYCISVDTIGFENYFNELYSFATTMDELWCDNLWRNMTHEAITNFDWTYTREYEEGEEEENILGGTRMEGILRIWGRTFDDIKRYIDNIKLKNCITYDNSQQNTPNAELSDKCELLGWEVYSTKPDKSENLYLNDGFIEKYITKLDQNERWGDTESSVSYKKWFDSKNPESVSQNTVDNNYMNKLVLSSGEIFRTKGTKQAIEMVFNMFGIGNNRDDSPEFRIQEKYYTITPKKRNDIFYFYKMNLNPIDPEQYVHENYDTLYEYLDENPATIDSPAYIEISGICYELITDMTVGDFCEYLIYTKAAALNYEDDEFSGTPIKDVYIDNEHYIVPYFNQDRIYDGEPQFETKGGWGKKIENGENPDDLKTQEYNYLETIPYMPIIQKVGALLEVNPFQIDNKKIFYVVDLSDLAEFVETIPNNISHFFKLDNPNSPNLFSSWKNIPSDGQIDPSYAIFDGVTEDDIKLAEYNDKLALDNLGNNPHCGYSSYDLGNEYLEYIKQPFKHAIENYGFVNLEDESSARQFIFEINEHSGDKVLNLTNGNTPLAEQSYYYTSDSSNLSNISLDDCVVLNATTTSLNLIKDLTLIIAPEDSDVSLKFISNGIKNVVTECSEQPCLIRIDNEYVTDLPNGYKVLMYYFDNINNVSSVHIVIDEHKLAYVLPSKAIVLTNVIYNDLYREYLYNTIMKYVLQVIPSTTILMLKEENYTLKDTAYYTGNDTQIQSISLNDCTIYSGNNIILNEINDLTVIAVKKNVNVTLKFTSNGIENTVEECGEQPCLTRITNDFIEGLPDEYKVLMYTSEGMNAESARLILNKD